jgi:hypothetical protein
MGAGRQPEPCSAQRIEATTIKFVCSVANTKFRKFFRVIRRRPPSRLGDPHPRALDRLAGFIILSLKPRHARRGVEQRPAVVLPVVHRGA